MGHKLWAAKGRESIVVNSFQGPLRFALVTNRSLRRLLTQPLQKKRLFSSFMKGTKRWSFLIWELFRVNRCRNFSGSGLKRLCWSVFTASNSYVKFSLVLWFHLFWRTSSSIFSKIRWKETGFSEQRLRQTWFDKTKLVPSVVTLSSHEGGEWNEVENNFPNFLFFE